VSFLTKENKEILADWDTGVTYNKGEVDKINSIVK